MSYPQGNNNQQYPYNQSGSSQYPQQGMGGMSGNTGMTSGMGGMSNTGMNQQGMGGMSNTGMGMSGNMQGSFGSGSSLTSPYPTSPSTYGQQTGSMGGMGTTTTQYGQQSGMGGMSTTTQYGQQGINTSMGGMNTQYGQQQGMSGSTSPYGQQQNMTGTAPYPSSPTQYGQQGGMSNTGMQGSQYGGMGSTSTSQYGQQQGMGMGTSTQSGMNTQYGQPGMNNQFTQQPGGYTSYAHNYSNAPANVDPNIANWFQRVDADRSGSVSAQELVTALGHGGYNIGPEAANSMIKLFNMSGTGQLSLSEFQHLATWLNQMKQNFQQLDSNGNGALDYNEVQRALQLSGNVIDPQLLSRIVTKFDKTRTGSLKVDGYLELCLFLNATKDVFDANDFQRTGRVTFSYDQFVSAAFALQYGLKN